MKIHIFDGPPSLGVTEVVRNIGLREKSKNTLCIPHFSKKVDLKSISSNSISTTIEASIRDLLERIDIAKADKYSALYIDGSPISYLAYAKVKGVDIEPIVIEYINLLTRLIGRRTYVSLRLPNTGFPFPKNTQTMTPEEEYTFSMHLRDEYKKRFFTTIKPIGLH